MTDQPVHRSDVWASGAAYEPYVGRWSRRVARVFIDWLAAPPGSRWLDVGCGTGALSQTILQTAAPSAVKGVDRSESFIVYAREQVRDPLVHFEVGDGQALAMETATYDAVVSGLVLNFVPQPEQMVAEMARVARAGGRVAVYVWDYAGKMQLMRHFWDAAVALDPSVAGLDEGRRFPVCQPGALIDLFYAAGLADVELRAIDVETRFQDFDDYWSPFFGSQGPAPTYAMSLSEEQRGVLRNQIHAGLPIAPDGSISLIARAWAVRGRRGGSTNGDA